MSKNTYRPRVGRERRDTIIKAGERLNGDSVTFNQALGLISRYLDVLNGNVTCPQCGATDIEAKGRGSYYCWRCEEDHDSGHFNAYDVLNVADKEKATLPGTAQDVQYRFECDCGDGDSGTNSSVETSDTQNQQATTTNTHQNQWDEGW